MKKILRGIKSIVNFPIDLLACGILALFYGGLILKMFILVAFGIGCIFIGASAIIGPILVIAGLVLKITVMVTIGAILLAVVVCTVVCFKVLNRLDDFYWEMKGYATLPVREIYIYKGENVWEAAAEEYRKISGKPEDAELTEEEKKKIYDYTMMPMSYFFGWLCKRRLLGKGFAKEVGREKVTDIQKRIKDGRSTPQEILAELEYRFSEDWVDGDAKNFLLRYFKTEDCRHDGSKDRYPYDYYECNGEPEDRYFCLEYSREIQKKMNERLDARYEEYGSIQSSENEDDGE